MTRWFLSVLIFLLIPVVAFCQQNVMEVQRSGTTFYLSHTVASKESFYSIGRLYNVSPRELAAFNQLDMNKGLNVGQSLRIPLDDNNFTQSTSKNAAEALVPLYHKVASGETLFRIGTNFKNVPVNSLKQWNQLTSDNVKSGSALIVGYLKVSKTESSLANTKFTVPSANTDQVEISKTPSTPVEQTTPKETPVTETKPEPVVSQPQQTVTRQDGEANEGFFKNDFLNAAGAGQLSSANATTAVFKSTSGWQDGKFYCFNNDAAPGSIVKISIPGSGKSVYAKVLDAIPDIKRNEGVRLVLSNAAANSLGIADEKFQTTVSYIK